MLLGLCGQALHLENTHTRTHTHAQTHGHTLATGDVLGEAVWANERAQALWLSCSATV